MKFKKQILVLLGISVLAVILRLPTLFNRGGFWLDEIFTSQVSQLSLSESLKYLVWENNPPLHFWLLHFLGESFGFSEIVLRLFSVCASLAAIIVSYLLAKKIFNNQRTGYFVALISAVSYFHIFFSTEARMYSLLYLLCLLALYFFYLFLETGKRTHLFFNALFTVLALYTHLTASYLLIIENLFFAYYVYQTRKPIVKSWLLSQIVVVLSYLPWLVIFLTTKTATFNREAWYLYSGTAEFYPWFQTKQFLYFTGGGSFIELCFFIVFLAALGNFIFNFKRENKQLILANNLTLNKLLILLIYLVPLIVGFVFNVSIAKYFIIGSLGLYLMLAVLLDKFFDFLQKKRHKMVFLCFILIIFLLPVINNFKTSLYNWPAIFNYIEKNENKNDIIVLAPNSLWPVLNYYYQGQLSFLTVPVFQEQDLLLAAFKTNWNVAIKQQDLDRLAQDLTGHKRVFLISGRNDTPLKNDLVFMWFLKNGWQVEDVAFFPGVYDYKTTILTHQPKKTNL